MRKPLLIIKTGDTIPEIEAVHGDYDHWFTRCVDNTFVTVIEVHKEEALLPKPVDFAGVIITGSPHSVTEPKDWTHRLGDWTLKAHYENLPCLGVCYGHQILGHAFGGQVITNPVKYEIGTVEVTLTEAGLTDPLLGGLTNNQSTLAFNAVHGDVVSKLPAQAVCLAGNDATPNQAFRIGKSTWGVQFHPEFSEEVMRMYVDGRRENIIRDAQRRGLDPESQVKRVKSSIRKTPIGPKLIKRFVSNFVYGDFDEV